MTIKNQALYNALQDVSNKHSIVEGYREMMEKQLISVVKAKAEAVRILEELPSEQVEALMAKPIHDGDALIRIRFDSNAGVLVIDVSNAPETLSIYELMGDEERAAVRQRVAAKRAAGGEEG